MSIFGEFVEVPRQDGVNNDSTDNARKAALNTVRCPSCESRDIQYLGNQRKSFSVGKAVGGAVLTGGVGLLAGFVGKRGKDSWVCLSCGKKFSPRI